MNGEMLKRDLTGMRFGRLMVIDRARNPPGGRNAFWNCQCDCGNETIGAAANLGKTKFSCGCLKRESARDSIRRNSRGIVHGMSRTPEHNTWMKIQDRCHNPHNKKYPIYGGRGIGVCKRWLDDFRNFYADMGPRPGSDYSIDRIDNDRSYGPDNCRWATKFQQGGNKRNNRIIAVDGERLHMAEWCRRLNVKPWKLYDLTSRGPRDEMPRFESMEAAITHLIIKKAYSVNRVD